jgi:hypothetical protein
VQGLEAETFVHRHPIGRGPAAAPAAVVVQAVEAQAAVVAAAVAVGADHAAVRGSKECVTFRKEFL